MAFVMLNPSTADEKRDDRTVAKCIKYAVSWGFRELCVLNLFALRSTDPKILYREDDPVGPDNDRWFRRVLPRCARVVCAWGNHGAYLGRGKQVLEMIGNLGHEPWALVVTKTGQPGHPLFLPAARAPSPPLRQHSLPMVHQQ